MAVSYRVFFFGKYYLVFMLEMGPDSYSDHLCLAIPQTKPISLPCVVYLNGRQLSAVFNYSLFKKKLRYSWYGAAHTVSRKISRRGVSEPVMSTVASYPVSD